jgi:hypothetical protein
MNNFIHRRLLPSGSLLITTIFLLAFLCASSTTVQAQNLQAPASYNWKTSEDATNILLSQVTVLNQQMPGITEGTSLYDNTLRRVAYFKAIIMEISKGANVAEALELSVPAAATLGFEKEASYTPKILLKALHTETRVMLTN